MLDEIFGDCVHQNPGQHLSQGVPEDADWQDCWRRLVVFPSQTCDLSKGKVGRLFLEMLSDIIDGILARQWNAERLIVFQLVILQR